MSKNSKQYRAEGYATIFRNEHVYLIRRDAPTHARIHPVLFGRWMECPIADMAWTSLKDLTAPLRDDIRAALAVCYCDQGVDLCDFCGNVRRPPTMREQMIAWLVATDADVADDEARFPWVLAPDGSGRGYDDMTDDEIAQLYAYHDGPTAEPTHEDDTVCETHACLHWQCAHIHAQPALPGAEDVRETENPTPAYDAPFSLTPKVAPAIPPRALRLFNNRHED